MSLVVFTALVGMMIAPGHVHPVIGFTALLCISVGAGAAGALNMWYDADIDALMTRTAGRPIPQGRIAPGEALGFGMTLAGILGGRARPARELARGGAAGLHHLLLRRRLHDVAQALDAAEHRHRRRRGRLSADDRLGGGDRRAYPSSRACCFSSCCSGRRRISGRCRSPASMTMRAPACRCCRWSPERMKPGGKFCSIPSCSRSSVRRRGFSAIAGALYGVTALLAGALMVAFAWQVAPRARRQARRSRGTGGYLRSPSCISSSCLPCC